MPKARAKTPAASTAVPWWLTQGEEECPSCEQPYILELEFRCPDCDAPTCMHCKRRHSDGRLVCVSCHKPGEHSHGR